MGHFLAVLLRNCVIPPSCVGRRAVWDALQLFSCFSSVQCSAAGAQDQRGRPKTLLSPCCASGGSAGGKLLATKCCVCVTGAPEAVHM